jgi:hypothetical protein
VTIRIAGIAGMLRPFADWTLSLAHALLGVNENGAKARG